MHTPSEVCVDSFQADRAPDKHYRTSPLNGLWTHTKGGFYHDGRFSTLLDVVNHYDSCFSLGLSDQDKIDLVEFLKSLPQPENGLNNRTKTTSPSRLIKERSEPFSIGRLGGSRSGRGCGLNARRKLESDSPRTEDECGPSVWAARAETSGARTPSLSASTDLASQYGNNHSRGSDAL